MTPKRPERPASLRGVSSLVLSGVLASMLVAVPAQAQAESPVGAVAISPASAAGDEPVTTTELELLPLPVSPDYVAAGEVPEGDGDAQQQRLLEAGTAVAPSAPEASEEPGSSTDAGSAAPDPADAGQANGDDSSETAPEQAEAEQEAPEPPTAGVARVDLHSDIAAVGVHWPAGPAAPESVHLRTLIDGAWTSWMQVEIEEGAGEAGEPAHARDGTEPVSVTNAESVEVVVYYADPSRAADLALAVIDPRGAEPVRNALDDDSVISSQTDASRSVGAASTTFDTGPGFGLKINTRAGWGANESIRRDYDKPRDGEVTYRGAVVHHTAHGGPNNYSQEQVPGLIRSFYQYQAVVLDWGDIGYQLLVDRFGGVWEGRNGSLSRTLLGTHALGGNFETFGVAVIGTWTSEAPPAAATDSTALAIGWMFDKYGISNANGTIRVPGSNGNGGLGGGRTVPKISGHRQISVTACPGDAFFARLPALRAKVAELVDRPLSGMVSRHSGSDRYATAASAALAAFPSGAGTVYIAGGSGFADALAGGAAAGADDAPVLLVGQRSVPSQTLSALRTLSPTKIVVLGGTGAVGASVVRQLQGLGATVTRYGGATRYDTAAQLALAKFPSPQTVYVASGADFPDALAAVPVAGADGAPMLLTTPGALPAATEQALRQMRPSQVVVLGGSGAVSASVEARIAEASGVAPTRYAGANRFDTAARIALSKYPSGVDTVYVASAKDFPDALSGGPAAVKREAPLLIVSPDSVPTEVQSALIAMGPKRIVILGGTGAISPWNERRLDRFIVP